MEKNTFLKNQSNRTNFNQSRLGPNELGEVKIGDVIYNAKSIDNKPIEEGKDIVIKAIEGNTLVVETKKEN